MSHGVEAIFRTKLGFYDVGDCYQLYKGGDWGKLDSTADYKFRLDIKDSYPAVVLSPISTQIINNMSNELIFITGATGFIGSATAVEALKAGYRLRVCLRKPSKQLETLLSEYSDQVEFVIIPDLTDETAFDGKLNGVDYVLHLASPLPHGIDKEAYFGPAVKGTTALLKAAAKVPTIKKVVVTSSIAAFIPLSGIPAGGVVKGTLYHAF
jgi:FlaA1/EpsC-like NDP-sugar epimerase